MSFHSLHDARACCDSLRDELERQLRRTESIYFGPELAQQRDPDVARLDARGAHFYWVALALGGASFWDAHVGVVVDPATLMGTVGIHRSRGSADAARMFAGLVPAFESHRLAHYTSEAADEEQWNGEPLDVSSPAGVTRACRELVLLLEAARDGCAARKPRTARPDPRAKGKT